VGSGCHELCHGSARIVSGDEGLTDQDGVSTLLRVHHDVGRTANAGLGDRDDAGRNRWGDPREGSRVNLERLEVARVDADDPGTGRQGPFELVVVMNLDKCGHAERLGAFDE
jgi:hypothetical protein